MRLPQSVTRREALAVSTRGKPALGAANFVSTQTSSSLRKRSPACSANVTRPKSSTSSACDPACTLLFVGGAEAPYQESFDALYANPCARQTSTPLLPRLSANESAKSSGTTISMQSSALLAGFCGSS